MTKEVSIADNVLGERIKEVEAFNAELVAFIKGEQAAGYLFDWQKADRLIAKAEGKK